MQHCQQQQVWLQAQLMTHGLFKGSIAGGRLHWLLHVWSVVLKLTAEQMHSLRKYSTATAGTNKAVFDLVPPIVAAKAIKNAECC
jgi:hypothetical protein